MIRFLFLVTFLMTVIGMVLSLTVFRPAPTVRKMQDRLGSERSGSIEYEGRRFIITRFKG